jgi:hypothetical protein
MVVTDVKVTSQEDEHRRERRQERGREEGWSPNPEENKVKNASLRLGKP